MISVRSAGTLPAPRSEEADRRLERRRTGEQDHRADNRAAAPAARTMVQVLRDAAGPG